MSPSVKILFSSTCAIGLGLALAAPHGAYAQTVEFELATGYLSGGAIQEGTRGGGVTSGDLDNDGDIDLVVFKDSRVVILENTSTPGSMSFVDRSAGFKKRSNNGDSFPRGQAVLADYDNDGDLDIFGTSQLFDQGLLWENHLIQGPASSTAEEAFSFTYVGNGRGLSDVIFAGHPQKGVAVLDMDADGDLDVVYDTQVADYDARLAFANQLAQTGQPTFVYLPEETIETQILDGSADFMTALDYDLDGDTDVQMRSSYNGNLNARFEVLYRNISTGPSNLLFEDITGTITPTVSNNNSTISGGMAWSDFNMDGNPDIFAQNGTGQPSTDDVIIRVTRPSGNESFENVNSAAFLGVPMTTNNNLSASGGIALQDFDNDGDVDLFYGSYGGTLLENDQAQTGLASVGFSNQTASFPFLQDQFADYEGVVAADFDNDGDLDIYANLAESNKADLLINNLADPFEGDDSDTYVRVRATCDGRDCLGATVQIFRAGLKEFDDSRVAGGSLPDIGYGTPYAIYAGYPNNPSHPTLSTRIFPGTFKGQHAVHGGMSTTGQTFITHFGGLLPEGRYTVRVLFPGGTVVLKDIVPRDMSDDFNGVSLDHFVSVDRDDVSDDGDGIPADEEISVWGSDPLDLDSDDDGISDWREVEILGTSPSSRDADGDGIPDGIELGFTSTNKIPDPDGTGPLKGTGTAFAADADPTTTTDPLNPDTDGDGLCDGNPASSPAGCSGREDSNNNGRLDASDYSNPLDLDTDDDAVSDFDESQAGSNPRLTDSDSDGIADGVELGRDEGIDDPDGDGPLLGTSGTPALDADPSTTTDPASTDSDGDGLTDGIEDSDKDGFKDLTETDPSEEDTDSDGLLDGIEDKDKDGQRDANETDPLDPDSDGDGIIDGTEDANHNGSVNAGETNPLNPDTDGDGLCDGGNEVDRDCEIGEDENNNGVVDDGETDPLDPDTDGDSLNDGDEELDYGTNPLSHDTDGDGLCDGIVTPASPTGCRQGEKGVGADVTNTDPTDPDSDDDRLCDGPKTVEGVCVTGEVGNYNTDPNEADTDEDGLTDYVEVIGEAFDPGSASDILYVNHTDPRVADSDGDCIVDGDEDYSKDGIFQGGIGGELNPNAQDTDGDGLPDSSADGDVNSEANGACSGRPYPTSNHISDPTNPDTDGDGLTDGVEVETGVYQTDPEEPDHDGDGLCDGPNDVEGVCIGGEVGGYGTDPTNPDTDGDTLKDGEEVTHPTESTLPNNPDTDGDGLRDDVEVGSTCTLDARDSDSDDDGLCDGPAPFPEDAGCSVGSGNGEDRNANCVVEGAIETDPGNPDSDGDGLCDGAIAVGSDCQAGEIGAGVGGDGSDTNPLDPDTDNDGLCDGPNSVTSVCTGGEVGDWESDPVDPDTDGDGLCDGYLAVQGVCIIGEVGGGVGYDGGDTHPLYADTDGDGLCDGPAAVSGTCEDGEHGSIGTDPLNIDTDGGCQPDGEEVANGTDPKDDPTDDECNDGDGDGLSNAVEESIGSDPNDADSDDDGVMDGNEACLEAGVFDVDGDQMPCFLDADSDNDGLPDGVEIGLTAPQPLSLGETYAEFRDSTDLSHCPVTDEGELESLRLLQLWGCSFWADQDPGTTTDPLLADTDGGGADDGAEDPNHNGMVDAGELDPNSSGDDPAYVTSPSGCELGTVVQDSDCDGLTDDEESYYNLETIRVDPLDADTDDDGLPDGMEANWNLDYDYDRLLNIRDPDSDDDGVTDGIEMGITSAQFSADTDTTAGFVNAGSGFGDQDPSSVSSPISVDTDQDGADDGAEDPNHNGAIDVGERDPGSSVGEDFVPAPSNLDEICFEGDPLLEDTDCDGLSDLEEEYFLLPIVPESAGDPREDGDIDDDGLLDGSEDNWSLVMDPTSTFICAYNPDCDGDQILDGTERSAGRTADTDRNSPNYKADADGGTTSTSMVDADTDGGGIDDGTEDRNLDGQIQASESDPNDPTDDCTDLDLDGICDEFDNCACDPEVDEDCSLYYNPGQEDGDGDGVGNICDICPEDTEDDVDGDGICGSEDNCPLDYNPQQEDVDGDTLGNVCDSDCDGNGITNEQEEELGMEICDTDSDGDGLSDAIEVGDPDCFIEGQEPETPGAIKDGRCDPFDSDTDGIADAVELDSDNDTIPDSVESGLGPNDEGQPVDTDEDGTPDYRELDSDNDGYSDELESGSQGEYALNYDPRDTDGDNLPDYIDEDSDNDNLSDMCERRSVGTSCNNVPGEGTGTDAYVADSDGGGVSDGDEFDAGTNPRNDIDDGIFLAGGGGCNTASSGGSGLGVFALALLALGAGRRRRRLGLAAAMLLALSLVMPSAAIAQDSDGPATTDRLNAQLFRPALDGGSFITVWDADALRRWHFTVGLSTNYAYRPLQFKVAQTAGGTTSYVYADSLGPVDHLVTSDLYGAVGLTDFLTVAASVPVTWYGDVVIPYSAAEPTLEGYVPQTARGMGDAWLAVKSQLLDPRQKLIGLSLIPELSIPLVFSDEGYFLSDEQTTFRVRTAAEMRIPRLHLGANLAFRVRPRMFDFFDVTYRHAVEYGLAAHVPLIEGLAVQTEFIGSRGLQNSENQDWTVTSPAEFLVGARYDFGWGLLLNLGGGVGVTEGMGAPRARGYFAATYRTPLQLDTDGDGILDRLDQCPTDPENFNGVLDEDGCPEPDTDGDRLVDPVDACPSSPEDYDGYQDEDGCPDHDNDADGIPDDRDQCPMEAEDRDGFEDTDGCPDIDNDNDGLYDKDDKCPNRPEDFDGFQDDDGCPEEDNDGDGVPDAKDRCPNDKEDIDGWEDEDGCPDRDNDGDGIPDDRDRCPNEAEVINDVDDDDGCPDEGNQLVVIEEDRLVILFPVHFEFNKATIRADSATLLRQIATTLKMNPYIKKIRIEGHTDSIGNDEYNLKLSQGRAESVMQALLDNGVEAERLEAIGYGESRPIESNDTEAGRERNRRVDFIIVEREERFELRKRKPGEPVAPAPAGDGAQKPAGEAPAAPAGEAAPAAGGVAGPADAAPAGGDAAPPAGEADEPADEGDDAGEDAAPTPEPTPEPLF